MKTQEEITHRLESMKNHARNQLTEFAAKINSETPAEAMTWSAKSFISAAEYEFATGWLSFFNEDFDVTYNKVEYFINRLRTNVLHEACNASNKSTSVTANYVDECSREVTARFLSLCCD